MVGTLRSEQVRDGTIGKDKLADSAFYVNITSINNGDSPYSVVADDELILVDTTGGPVTINLPTLASTADGREIIIKDAGGDAGTNNITIDPDGFELIDGATSAVLVADYTAITLLKTSLIWVRLDSTGTVNFLP